MSSMGPLLSFYGSVDSSFSRRQSKNAFLERGDFKVLPQVHANNGSDKRRREKVKRSGRTSTARRKYVLGSCWDVIFQKILAKMYSFSDSCRNIYYLFSDFYGNVAIFFQFVNSFTTVFNLVRHPLFCNNTESALSSCFPPLHFHQRRKALVSMTLQHSD